MPKFVQVHSVSRHYGGPEEGGWWYDKTYVGFSIRRKNRIAKKIYKALKSFVEKENSGKRRDRFSMAAGNTPDLEADMGSHGFQSDLRRPRYE